MIVQPTFQKPDPPSLSEVLYALEREIMKNMSCVRPGVIIDFNPGDATHGPTATVQIAQNQVTSTAPDGTQTVEQFPPCGVAPVWFLGGGGFTVTTPIKQGDECIILFSDRELNNWLNSGNGTTPTTDRLHDLSDAIVLVGLRSNPRGLPGISTTALQIRSDDYTGPTGTGECVEVGPGKIQIIADEVVMHARTKLVYDADGNGTVFTSNTRTDYVIGSTGSSENLNPPEVPT